VKKYVTFEVDGAGKRDRPRREVVYKDMDDLHIAEKTVML